MGRKVEVKISYSVFYDTLKRSEDYTDEDIRELFQSVREMDSESRGWVIDMIKGNGLPKTVVEGVTASYLVNVVGMQPINALIALNWLKHEPETAKYYILKLAKEAPENDAVREKMKSIADAMRKDKEEPENEEAEPSENTDELILDGEIDQP